MKELLRQKKRVLIGGHRGCSCDFTENTIPAMKEGLRRGADYLEIDVQLTKDEQLVIYHDTRLEKHMPLEGYVHEFELAQLREAYTINTLDEVLDWGKQNNVSFALELKGTPFATQNANLRLAELLPLLVKRAGMEQQIYAFGADYQVLKKIKQTQPKFNTGLIVPFVPQDPVLLVKETGAMVYLSYIYNMTAGIIEELHAADCFVSGAILRDDYWVMQAVKAGVDMFETDFPEKYASLK